MPIRFANLFEERLDHFSASVHRQQRSGSQARSTQRRHDDVVELLVGECRADACGLYLTQLGERWVDDVEFVADPFGLTVADEDDLHDDADRRASVDTVSDSLSSGWFPDPTGRYEYRYFNGQRWTADVAVHGQRYVDPLPSQAPRSQQAGRGFAIAAFVVALGSLLVAWLPFIFVAGLIGGITAFVFAMLGLVRARRNGGHGRGFAVAGTIISVLALALCTVGFLFTRTFLREIDAYNNPGPHATAVTSCTTLAGFGAEMHGTITNLDTTRHEYNISVAFTASGADTVNNVRVLDVAPAASVEFSSSAPVMPTGSITCRVDAVYGPEPFADMAP